MKTLATYSIKGGVGKTTCAVNLAYEAAAAGGRVLLWDLDPQGAATFLSRIRPHIGGGVRRLIGDAGMLAPHLRGTDTPGLDLLPADFSLRHLDRYLDAAKRPTKRLTALLEGLGDRYDIAILDCAPGITLSSESVFVAVDALLVPTIPTPLSARTLEQLAEFLARSDDAPLVLPFLSMVDARKRRQHELAAKLITGPLPFLTTAIPNLSIIEQMTELRSPVATYAPKSAATAAFRSLWREISERLWDPSTQR